MKYVRFQDAMNLSKLGMGAMRLPVNQAEPGTPIDRNSARQIIDYVLSNGVNYFDTAYIYHGGESEPFLGEALGRHPRESYCLADKYNLHANPDYEKQFREQLSRLKTDRIDFYMIHGVQDSFMGTILNNGCIPYFESRQAKGEIKYFGFSFHGTPDALRKMVAVRRWDFAQIQLNYFDWFYGDAKELYGILEQANIPIMVMEPLRGGKLAMLTSESSAPLTNAEPDRSVASWAMRWLMSLPQVAVVLSGMSDISQAEDNVKIFSEYKPLSEREKEALSKACEIFRPAVSVACTNCRYCVDDCPAALDIPRIVSIYNEVKLDHAWRATFLDNLPEDRRPSACAGCGVCVGCCPQGIDIPACMKELAAIAD